MTPVKSHGRQIAFLMFVNCLAAPVACVLTFIFSKMMNDFFLWRLLACWHAIPAFLAYLWTRSLPESDEWLALDDSYRKTVKQNIHREFLRGIKSLFTLKYRNITICLMAAWFLMDIAYYSINFFIPYLLKIIKLSSFTDTILETFIINLFFVLGAFFAIFIIDKINYFKLQQYGFLFSCLSLFLLAIYFHLGLQQTSIIIILFIIFNFAMNLGLMLQRIYYHPTSYPVELREQVMD